MSGRHRASFRRRWLFGAVPLTIVLTVVSIALTRWAGTPATDQQGAGRTAQQGTATHTSALPKRAPAVIPGVGAAAGSGSPGRAAAPVRLTIPAIGVRSGLQPLGLLKDGSLEPPSRWQEAGWYAGGVVPGEVGPAVVAGHIDSTTGPAIFYRLRALRTGARVIVLDRAGISRTFSVDRIQRFAKSRFPTVTVYGPTPDAELRLITCTGSFDVAKLSYVDNLVVSAHLVAVSRN